MGSRPQCGDRSSYNVSLGPSYPVLLVMTTVFKVVVNHYFVMCKTNSNVIIGHKWNTCREVDIKVFTTKASVCKVTPSLVMSKCVW